MLPLKARTRTMLCLIVEGFSDDKQIREALTRTHTHELSPTEQWEVGLTRTRNDKVAIRDSRLRIIVTHGTKFGRSTRISVQKALDEGYKVYTLSDPDVSGRHLHEMVTRVFPNIQRIHVDKKKARYKTIKRWKYGVEYCSYDYLRELLGRYLNDSSTGSSGCREEHIS